VETVCPAPNLGKTRMGLRRRGQTKMWKTLGVERNQRKSGGERPQRQKQALERGGVTFENAKENNVLRLEI